MTVMLELPLELETVLQQKAQNAGVSMPDFLLLLARQEAESSLHTSLEINGFIEADSLSSELSEKVQRLLGN